MSVGSAKNAGRDPENMILRITRFWSENEKGGKYGVAIAVRRRLASSVSAWKPVSNRLMWLRCNARNVPITIVQCNAPTDCSDAEAKDTFYVQLAQILDEITRKCVLGTDFQHKCIHMYTHVYVVPAK